MAELRCADGTVVQISKETELELRKAFGKPERTYTIGDVFWRDHSTARGCHYVQLGVKLGDCNQVALFAPFDRFRGGNYGTQGGYTYVEDSDKITMTEIRRMTSYPQGLRRVDVDHLVITEK